MEKDPYDQAFTSASDIDRDASNAANNARYVAITEQRDIIVKTADESITAVWSIERPQLVNTKLIVEFSPINSTYLAVSNGSKLDIYDVLTRKILYSIRGIARAISAIAWSLHEWNVLATGHLDGSLCTWRIDRPSIPITTSRFRHGAIQQLAWYSRLPEVLAVCSDTELYICCSSSVAKSVQLNTSKHDRVRHLTWHPRHPARLLVATDAGSLVIWHLEDLVHSTNKRRSHYGLGDGGLRDVEDGIITPSSSTRIGSLNGIIWLFWTEDAGILMLCENGTRILALDPPITTNHTVTKWLVDLDVRMTMLVAGTDNKESLFAINSSTQSVQEVSTSVIDGLALCPKSDREGISAVKPAISPCKSDVMAEFTREARMKSTRIKCLRLAGKQPHRSTRRSTRSGHVREPHGFAERNLTKSSVKTRPISTSTQFTALSLEVPKPRDDDAESPMPFLSPSIPIRKVSPEIHSIPSLEPSLPRSITDMAFGSFSSTDLQDSDSDDDAYDIQQKDTGSVLMPGGVNVPLPRSCGAVFAPNGTLVTFVPPASRPQTAEREDVKHHGLLLEGPSLKKPSVHFPGFGNLAADSGDKTGQSELQIPGVDGFHAMHDTHSPELQSTPMFPSSPWRVTTSSSGMRPSQSNLPNVSLSVCTLEGSGLAVQRLATKYRVLRENGESGAAVCEHNAVSAEAVGNQGAAKVWTILSFLLAGTIATDDLQNFNPWLKTPTAIDTTLPRYLNKTKPAESHFSGEQATSGNFRWSDHPFGSQWLILQMFDNAESRADLQMLAHLSAILMEESSSLNHASMGSMAMRLATHSPSFSSYANDTLTTVLPNRPIPTLHTDLSDSIVLQESPARLHSSSRLAPFATSQPATPHLESSSSTPPWSFPRLAQSSTGVSLSGSASPEAHRASFSAAVKSYAQSVSDKLASYGTSPPVRRSGLSPGNELSSSLPSGGGSWSKSVSFASSVGTAQNSISARDHVEREDEYDSDRTIDDNSLPQTPAEARVEMRLTWKNQNAFSDDISGLAKAPLLPPDLLPKCRIWMQTYASHLRCLGLNSRAVEFEKLSGAIAADVVNPTTKLSTVDGVSAAGTVVCTICFCITGRLGQVCPSCLHASHFQCLQELLSTDLESDFECPAGCGCNCAELSHSPMAWESQRPFISPVRIHEAG